MLFNILGPTVSSLSHKSRLGPHNELFLTLMKLRLAKDDMQLHIDFGISRQVVGKVFITWLNFMFFELKEHDIWLPKIVVQEHFPIMFKNMFPDTRVILDATETPVVRPSNADAQRITFSSCKHRNTAKTMIGITPTGLVSYLSPSYGGSTSRGI